MAKNTSTTSDTELTDAHIAQNHPGSTTIQKFQPNSKRMENSFFWRVVFLCLTSMLNVGLYFAYDNPAPIEKELEADLNITQTQFSLLYSVYSYPNMIFPVFSGILVDKIGVRAGLIVFSFVELIGQEGVFSGKFYKRQFKRFGCGNLSVAESTLVSKWFKGILVSFTFSLSVAVGSFASALNGIIMHLIYNNKQSNRLGEAFLFGAVICLLCFIAAVILSIMDKRNEFQRVEHPKKEVSFKLNDLKQLSYVYWLLVGLTFTLYASVVPYNQVVSKMMVVNSQVEEILAGQLFGVISVISAIFSPIFSIIADKYNQRIWFCKYLLLTNFLVLGASILSLMANFVIMIQPVCQTTCYYDMVPMVMHGFAYAAFSGIHWALISVVVQENMQGTAYGITTSVLYISYSTIPTIGSVIHDTTMSKKNGFFWVNTAQLIEIQQAVLWFGLSVLSLVLTLLLLFENRKKYKGQLNYSTVKIRSDEQETSNKASSDWFKLPVFSYQA